MSIYSHYVQEIIAAGQRLAQQSLVTAHSGNISLRLPQGGCLITASGVCKGSLTDADVLCLDTHGQVVSATGQKSPSSETPLHLALYKACSHISAIVHAHPPYATALASAGQQLDCQLLEEARLFLGQVPLLGYMAAGSTQLAQAAANAATGSAALLLAGHGAVSWGETMEQALCRMEIVEHTARVMLYKKLWQN